MNVDGIRAAIYIRVSREDGESDASESIINQENFLMQYAVGKGIFVADIYSDDGYTGMNMERPGLSRLKRDIESGKINLVLTKDISRLSRSSGDYSELTETFFAANNVRYIAVNDGVDTFGREDVMIVFRAAFNEIYPRDISIKVRSALRAKAKNGEFIGSAAPYGYKKSPFNKNKLIPNEDTALVVKRIFELYVAGSGYTAIAKELNRLGIPSPSAYNKVTYGRSHANASNLWGIDTIRKIIQSPVYIGTLTQHKESTPNIRLKKKKAVRKEDQIVVPNSHDPIIESSVFELAQTLNAKKAINSRSTPAVHVLSGSIFCGVCGSRHTFAKIGKGSRKGEFEALCSQYKRYSGCARMAIYEKDLEQIVTGNLKSLAPNMPEGIINAVSAVGFESPLINKQIGTLKTRLEDIATALKNLYVDKVKSVIHEELFLELSAGYLEDRADIYSKIERLEKEAAESGENSLGQSPNHYKDILMSIARFEILTKPTLAALIERIEIHKNRHIIIKYKFLNPY